MIHVHLKNSPTVTSGAPSIQISVFVYMQDRQLYYDAAALTARFGFNSNMHLSNDSMERKSVKSLIVKITTCPRTKRQDGQREIGLPRYR